MRGHRGSFSESLRAVEEHIAMVFHRFLVRPRPISIRLNGQAIKPWDPFLADDPATQRLPTENLGEPGDGVMVTPYVLPHHTRLSVEKHRAGGRARRMERPAGLLRLSKSTAPTSG